MSEKIGKWLFQLLLAIGVAVVFFCLGRVTQPFGTTEELISEDGISVSQTTTAQTTVITTETDDNLLPTDISHTTTARVSAPQTVMITTEETVSTTQAVVTTRKESTTAIVVSATTTSPSSTLRQMITTTTLPAPTTVHTTTVTTAEQTMSTQTSNIYIVEDEPLIVTDADDLPSTTIYVGKIPLNTATKEELMQVPGVGEVFAERIISYRDANGGFKNIDELKNVSGVGEKRFSNWSPYFVVY